MHRQLTLFVACVAAACGADTNPSVQNGADAHMWIGSDGGTRTLEDCFEGITARQPNRFVELLTMVTQPAGHRLILAREPGDRPGAFGETFPLDLVRFAIEVPGGDRSCITDPALLEYTFGHHNWDERAAVTVGARRYVIRLQYLATAEAKWTDTLTIEDTGGAVVDGPLVLEAAACRSIPLDLNTCFQRPRT
jgi:hypothetical protein